MTFRYRQISYRYLGGSPAEVEQFLRRIWGWERQHVAPAGVWRPPTDVYETDHALVVRIEIAGLHEEDIDVTLYDDVLVVTGRREPPRDGVRYHALGIPWGDFRSEVYLPAPIDRQTVAARYEAGLLTITLPWADRYGTMAT
jgi:HSP20 family molecular chaperone IbpA